MAKKTWINVDGENKDVKNCWENINGTWIPKVVPKLNISDIWKECMSYGVFYVAYNPITTTSSGGVLEKRDLQGNVLNSVALLSTHAICMEVDSESNVYIVTEDATDSNKKLAKYDKDLNLIVSISLSANYTYRDMCISPNGYIYLAVHYGSSSRWIHRYNASDLTGLVQRSTSGTPKSVDCDNQGNIISMNKNYSSEYLGYYRLAEDLSIILYDSWTTNSSASAYDVRIWEGRMFFAYTYGNTGVIMNERYVEGGGYVPGTTAFNYMSTVRGLTYDEFGNILILYGDYGHNLSIVPIDNRAIAEPEVFCSVGSTNAGVYIYAVAQKILAKDSIVYALFNSYTAANPGAGIVAYDRETSEILWIDHINPYYSDMAMPPGRVGAFLSEY